MHLSGLRASSEGATLCKGKQGQGRKLQKRKTKREVSRGRRGRSGCKESVLHSAKGKIGGVAAGGRRQCRTERVHFWVARGGGKRGHIFLCPQKAASAYYIAEATRMMQWGAQNDVTTAEQRGWTW